MPDHGMTPEQWRAAWRATTTARELAKAEAAEQRHRDALRRKPPVTLPTEQADPRPGSNVLEV